MMGTPYLQICCRQLLGIMRSGIVIDVDTCRYINTTFFNPTREAIAQMLAEPGDCEQETLLDLILTPSEAECLRLEALFESAGFSAEDEQRIVAALADEPSRIPIYMNGRLLISLALNEEMVCRYVVKLRMTRQPDPRLSAVIRRIPDEGCKTKLGIMLRHAPSPLTEPGMDVIAGLIERNTAGGGDLEKQIAFILDIMPELKNGIRLYDLLTIRKHFLESGIRDAATTRSRMDKYNPEMLIMTGGRVPYVDVEAAREQIDIIDSLCITLFGRTDILLPTPGVVDLGQAATISDLKKLTD
ncbi:MAG: hypothetical protein HKM93_21300 [Desulfobacteraceae bacterium]|nr:hypothetical protein [Desulfobacteraceae bacterium]